MRLETRRLLDRAFSSLGLIAIGVMALALVVILTPIIVRGSGAFIFRSTIEHRKVMFDQWDRGNAGRLETAKAEVAAARQPVYDMLAAFNTELDAMPRADRKPYKQSLRDLEKALAGLLGPVPGERTPVLIRQQYGATRWDRTQIKLDDVLTTEEWDYSDPTALGKLVRTPRVEQFRGTKLEPLFPYVEQNIKAMMQPRWTCYWQFLFDTSKDSHIFGGIGPEVLGTIYLTLGAMFFAIPMGVIAAIYLCEYAREGRVISFLRICISTLAGVPSIVFGLFGLAFFLNTIHISDSKSVLAGALTLSLLVLPTVIRASEEAILAVPRAYKEAAMSLGAGRWRTVMTVILPAALPGILTGVVISMGRAAGETAPIIFTAAVSVGRPLLPLEALSQPTPALSWNIYNLCTEHEAVDEIRHVQYGMVFTLVAVVLLLNVFAIIMRARISKKLRG
ncbi:MAG: phosphate ABC transporter permease PstA [Verrucomicrobia bacterium]|nr:phosphate ABC transporter permease PstA [Verrucomicrobiota bacterium]